MDRVLFVIIEESNHLFGKRDHLVLNIFVSVEPLYQSSYGLKAIGIKELLKEILEKVDLLKRQSLNSVL